MRWQVGMHRFGNEVIAVAPNCLTFVCCKCGNEFTRTPTQAKFYPPKSCGCYTKVMHNRRMAACFRNRPVFYGPKTQSECR